MSSLNSTNPFVRPVYFIITGFTGIPYVSYYYVFLFVCYLVALLANLCLMTIICVVRSLHTPKYMAIFTLALADLGENTALIPKVLETFLFKAQEITYEACLANMFFVFSFFGMQSFSLVLLAYDRFVAICFPLRYHSILTNISMGIMITAAWSLSFILVALMVAFITRLSFCNSVLVDSYFCDHGPIYRMACNDNSLNKNFSMIVIVTFIYLPVMLIGLSYASILLALLRIATKEERIKAVKTCLSHLLLVSVFFTPFVVLYFLSYAFAFHPNVRTISTSLSYIVPPVLNPIVYSLSTAEVKDFIKKSFKLNIHKGIVPGALK